jgi:hypothetical protein
MGSISIPTLTLIAASGAAVSAGVSAYASHEQGVAQANAYKQKARVEQEDAQQKQIAMRQNMLKALAAQNAGGLGQGLSRANTMRQITDAQNDLLVSKAGASAPISLLDSAASSARSAGDLGAVGDVIGGAGTVASDYAAAQAAAKKGN